MSFLSELGQGLGSFFKGTPDVFGPPAPGERMPTAQKSGFSKALGALKLTASSDSGEPAQIGPSSTLEPLSAPEYLPYTESSLSFEPLRRFQVQPRPVRARQSIADMVRENLMGAISEQTRPMPRPEQQQTVQYIPGVGMVVQVPGTPMRVI